MALKNILQNFTESHKRLIKEGMPFYELENYTLQNVSSLQINENMLTGFWKESDKRTLKTFGKINFGISHTFGKKEFASPSTKI